jgi:hypothetical protein
VAVVRAEPLAVMCEPNVYDGVLRRREEKIALAVELDLGKRALMAYAQGS